MVEHNIPHPVLQCNTKIALLDPFRLSPNFGQTMTSPHPPHPEARQTWAELRLSMAACRRPLSRGLNITKKFGRWQLSVDFPRTI
jgi:hypothetical protein